MLKIEVPWPASENLAGAMSGPGPAIWLDYLGSRFEAGQYSIWCPEALATLSFNSIAQAELKFPDDSVRSLAEPWEFLENWLGKISPAEPGFWGGALGFFTYEAYKLHLKLPFHRSFPDLPLAYWMLVDSGLLLDHPQKKAWLFSWGFEADLQTTHPNLAAARIERLRDLLSRKVEKNMDLTKVPELVYHEEKSTYLQKIEKIKSYLRRGDCYQVNLSQRFSMPGFQQPMELYLKLRESSPSPYMAYVHFEGQSILSASPELLLRQDGDVVSSFPIKGTRPRGRDADEDENLKIELWHSEKDNAELLMITDLVRNDLGRICKYGSVHVKKLKMLETYAQVHHLVSHVEGSLTPGSSPIEALLALSPGGSITGAPKLKAMAIIHELEAEARGIYTGSIGYFGFGRRACFNIAIRTALVNSEGLHYRAGGGVVADSDPELEYEETLHKARGLFYALGLEK